MQNVDLMVPGVTREFGTFSIFRRNNGHIEFLMENDDGLQWVDFDQVIFEYNILTVFESFCGLSEDNLKFLISLFKPKYLSNRNKFLVSVDKCVYSFVDDFGFNQLYTSRALDDILTHAENKVS